MKAFLLLLLFPLTAFAADLKVTWKNPTTLVDGTPMASTEILSSLVACGPTQTNLTLTVTIQGGTQVAVVPNATPGQTYVCGVQTNTKSNGSSDMAFSTPISVPVPRPSPPTGITLTVQANTTAYKLRQSVDGFAFVAIGTVAPGTSCDATHDVDGYSLVPRGAVTLASRFDTLPLLVFARCS